MPWPVASMSGARRMPLQARRRAGPPRTGDAGRTILRIQAYGLAAAVGQAVLVEAGALEGWPLKDILWYTF